MHKLLTTHLILLCAVAYSKDGSPQALRYDGQQVRLELRAAGAHGVRVTLRPVDAPAALPENPGLAAGSTQAALFTIREISEPLRHVVNDLDVEVLPAGPTIIVRQRDGRVIQGFQLAANGAVTFQLVDAPLYGLGGGGPALAKDADWRKLPVEYDRRGRLHVMQPSWHVGPYGSRNPSAVLVQPGAWAMYVAAPWGDFDLREHVRGVFLPWRPRAEDAVPQSFSTQHRQGAKGRPPAATQVPGTFDVFVFDAKEPARFLQDFSSVTGPAALPPKWALGYMQSHRTLEDSTQMVAVIDAFRARRLPLDAVIYLGTGFVPRGWNTMQPSLTFNPDVFKPQTPAEFIHAAHERHTKVVLHVVPWDRDRLPTLDAEHLKTYWADHEPLVKMGVDAFWPDEGDWLDLHERQMRHQLYYQGHLSSQPDRRPWALLRNGHPGIAQWGGWIWSGDTDSAWKSLEAQIAVGLNFSVSIAPFWGTDIGGFFANEELTGELYARWFQFGAFCASFRSHGTTWQTRLPWGWGQAFMGPREGKHTPLVSELNNPAIESVVKSYAELRYRLLPYTYTLAWEARQHGLPPMRPMWLHDAADAASRDRADQYLWGRDLLIAPVFEKGAKERVVHLPPGLWYDWWSGKAEPGGRSVRRAVDLATMPIYVRAGAILPLDPVRQHTSEKVDEPTTLRVHAGADGAFTLYDDDGISQAYLRGEGTAINLRWDDKTRRLTMSTTQWPNQTPTRPFRVELHPEKKTQQLEFDGKTTTITF